MTRIFLLLLWAVFPAASQIPSRQSSDTVKPQTAGSLEQPPLPHKRSLLVCSFKIHELGHSRVKYTRELGKMLSRYDLVAVQGLTAPPEAGSYPDGKEYLQDPEAHEFFWVMKSHGFAYSLSAEDTGPKRTNHRTTPETEWSVVFYKDALRPAPDLPAGFLHEDLSKNKIFSRVPHAHAFRTKDGTFDFVLINAHLYFDGKGKPRPKRRKAELAAIAEWINQHGQKEKDFIILGNLNIRDGAEFTQIIPEGWFSLNDDLDNTSCSEGFFPYDHVLYQPKWSEEIDPSFGQREIPLRELMMPLWKGTGSYPGSPYNMKTFPQYFSDHKPIYFRINLPEEDDD